MKKLMIAATLLASTVAMADLCDEVLGPAGNGCALYDVQFKFKTLAGKDARCTTAQLTAVSKQAWAQTWLGQNNQQAPLVGIAYLDNATRTFNGILWQCAYACFEGKEFANAGNANAGDINYVLWDKKAARLVSPAAVYTAPANGQPASWVGGGDAAKEQNKFEILGRYGKNATKVAAFWRPTMNLAAFPGEEIVAAGFGTWNTKLSVIKTVSGNAVAKLIPVVVTTAGDTCNDGSAMPSVLAYMCNDFKGWCCGNCAAASLAPASGTWSIKYNASKSKNGQLSKILPWEANGLQTYTKQ